MNSSFRCLIAVAAVFASFEAQAQSIRTNPGFNKNVLPANDDDSSSGVPLGFTINFFGKTRASTYVNNNGNLTFDTPLATYTPFGLQNTQREIIAPFFADVDTRRGKVVTFGQDTVNGHKAFGANYIDVGYFAYHVDKLNSFQVVLIDRSESGAGNFDIEFNYAGIQWETGDASGGVNGFGGTPATVGWSNGTSDPGTSFQLPGSMISGAFLDHGSYALIRQTLNQASSSSNPAIPGRIIFRARDGVISPGLTITSSILPNGTMSRPYSTTLTASGATGPFQWTLTPDVTAPPGLTVNQNGAVSGVPTATGTYSFTLGVTATTDDGPLTVYQRGSITINPPSIAIQNACPLDDGSVGRPYSITLVATGSNGGYTWSVDDRYKLPPGIALGANGLLAGTPQVPGTYIFNLRASAVGSSDIQPAQQLCHLTVNPAQVRLASGCALPNGTVGLPYSQLLAADGGVGPYRFQLIGQLPYGLSLAPSGQVAGTPWTADAGSFQINVVDSRGVQTSNNCSLTINSPAFSASGCPLPNAMTGVAYNAKLPGNYTWSLNGTLPAGLSLSPDGTVSGTPMTAGPAGFLLIATDGGGNQVGEVCSLAVWRGSLSISGCPLPSAGVGDVYRTSLNPVGGSAPYFFTADGSLPSGISFTTDGLFGGTASSPGTYPLNVTVHDATGQTFTQPCSLSVSPKPVHLATACPLPGGQLGQSYATQVSGGGGTPPYRFDFLGFLPDGIQGAADGSLTGTPKSLGGSTFVIRLTDAQNASADTVCSMNVALPQVPPIQISGVPAVAAPADSMSVKVQVDAPYSQPIDGQLVLNVRPDTRSNDGAANQADPRLAFANGQGTARFTIPAGSKQITVPLVSTGTVASTVTVSLAQLRVAGADLHQFPAAQIFSILPAAPVITSACYSKTSTGLSLQVNGYSTTRELTQAALTIGGQGATMDITGTANAYFIAPETIRAGGAFALTIPYDLTPTTTVPAVSLDVFNTVGDSGARTLQACQ